MSLEEVGPKRLGTTIREKWVLEHLLGVGGMASVYVARHKIGRLEAIKILHTEFARSEQIRARFEQEALAVNAFRHPGVVEVRDVDVTEDGAPFMVMELLEGEPLGGRIRREPPLEPAEVLGFARDVLDVLVEAHARHIVHRDIKPDNLFVQNGGRIKVLDFGIARVRSSLGRAKTQVGMTLGTMAYMPPEQARGQEIDGRADLYALGATMFRVLTGTTVHDAKTEGDLVRKTTSEPAPSIASRAPHLAPSVQAVIDRALAFDPRDRYPDAASMRGDVVAVLEGHTPPYASSAPPLPARAASAAPTPHVSDPTTRDAATYVAPARQQASLDTARQGGGASDATKLPATVDDPALMHTQAEGTPAPRAAPMPERAASGHPGMNAHTKVSAGGSAPPVAPTKISGAPSSDAVSGRPPPPTAVSPMPFGTPSRGVPKVLVAALVGLFVAIAGAGLYVASKLGGLLGGDAPAQAASPFASASASAVAAAPSANDPDAPAKAPEAKPAPPAPLAAAKPAQGAAAPVAPTPTPAPTAPATAKPAAPSAPAPAGAEAKGKGKGKPKKRDLLF